MTNEEKEKLVDHICNLNEWNGKLQKRVEGLEHCLKFLLEHHDSSPSLRNEAVVMAVNCLSENHDSLCTWLAEHDSELRAQVRRETLEEAADWFVRKDSYAWENLTRMAGEQHE